MPDTVELSEITSEKGPITYDICKFLAYVDPLPPLSAFCSIEFTQPPLPHNCAFGLRNPTLLMRTSYVNGLPVHGGGAEDPTRPDAAPPLGRGCAGSALGRGGRTARGRPPRTAAQFRASARRRQVCILELNF